MSRTASVSPLPENSRFPVFAAILIGSLLSFFTVQAQPDYAPAHWDPAYSGHWYTTGNGHKFVVIHDMEGYYQSTISYFQQEMQGSGYASAHYCVNGLSDSGTDAAPGDITQMVREQYYAWHVSCWNKWMFGTEHEGFVSNPAWYSPAMYQASSGLQRHLCDVYGIAKDRNHIIGHNEWQNSTWTSWMAANFPSIDTTCNNHTDPGVFWDWNYFMRLILETNVVTGHYWDRNGSSAGSGTTPSGTWDFTATNWNNSSAGTGTAGLWVDPDDAIFAAGSDAVNSSYTVTVSGTHCVNSLWIINGNVTFNGGGLYFKSTGSFYTNYVAAGKIATFNTPFTSGGAPDKWGPGTAVYNGASTVTGSAYMSINEGAIAIGNDRAFGPNKFVVGDPGGINAVTLKSGNSTAHTITNYIVMNANALTLDSGGDLTFSGDINLGTSGTTSPTFTVNNNSTFSGSLTNTAGFTKAGSGTLALSGASANSHGSGTIVSGGTLKLAKTDGVTAIPTAGVTINAGGTLLMAAENQISDTAPMTLAGGVFNTGGLDEQLGTLKLAGNSRINLGNTSASTLRFAASGGIAWTAGTSLTISNWNSSVHGGGAEQVFFGINSAGLTASQLSQVRFVNPPGFATGTYAAKILSTGEVVPLAVPPSFVSEPQSRIVLAGSNVVFSTAVSGTQPMSYRWLYQNGALPGQSGSSLALNNVSVSQAGVYGVIVTNIGGAISNTSIYLSVYPTAAATIGGPALDDQGRFSLSVTGVPGFRYLIEGSSNLLDWLTLSTNYSPFSFTNAAPKLQPAQFYRATYAP